MDATTLTIEQIPSHKHEISTSTSSTAGANGGYRVGGSTPAWNSDLMNDVGGNASHAHSLNRVTISNSSNLPSYYSLAYIMRLA